MGKGKRILLATAIAGTLDIGMAVVETARHGRAVDKMLRGLASGPFPDAKEWGAGGAALGLAVHYAIMAVMAAVFILAYDRIAQVRAHVLVAAALYGVGLWLVMYGMVLPLRFDSSFPPDNAIELGKELFAHVILVGLPIGLIARHGQPKSDARSGKARKRA